MSHENLKDDIQPFINWADDYLNNEISNYPVVSQVKPKEILNNLPLLPPLEPISTDEMLKQFKEKILPGITHWNHPMFMSLFNSTTSSPGIIAEFLTAVLNANGFLWLGSPALSEVEGLTLNWLKNMLGIPDEFKGIIYDSASTSTLHALACARYLAYGDNDLNNKGCYGNSILRMYASELAHSSIDKAVITLGLGLNNLVKIPFNENFSMDISKLEQEIINDIESGYRPSYIHITVGTTSLSSIDSIKEAVEVAQRYNCWLHVDAAYAGTAAVLDEYKYIFDGIEGIDSIVINPHKWMFTPVDLSAFYTKRPDILKKSFSLTPEYLKTNVDDAENLMDYGYQLGRRFRALKLWMIINYYGVNGIKAIISKHISLAKELTEKLKDTGRFEFINDTVFSLLCFRYYNSNFSKEKLNELNERLEHELNASGEIYISHTKINDKYIIRLVISGIRTEQEHANKAYELLMSKISEFD